MPSSLNSIWPISRKVLPPVLSPLPVTMVVPSPAGTRIYTARRNVSQQGLTQVQFPDFSRAQEELLIMWSENSKAVGFRTAAGASFA
ncbi:MAG: hypothetical protein FRX49_02914 [Trebouxia sp. A1-2]|nr:MAG: hypothetical protein FRX49_02914 [Trebouxia sp. A1-2]